MKRQEKPAEETQEAAEVNFRATNYPIMPRQPYKESWQS